METLGLVFELVFLGIGIYLYLFSRGFFSTKDADLQSKAEAFREENGWWLRLASLALVAIMAVNILLHIRQMLG